MCLRKTQGRFEKFYLHVVQQPLTCSGVREGLGEGLPPTVTSAKREVKEGDALLHFVCSCKQTVSRTPSSPKNSVLQKVSFSNFDIFKMRVSVDKICKFDFKFESKKLRRSIVR